MVTSGGVKRKDVKICVLELDNKILIRMEVSCRFLISTEGYLGVTAADWITEKQ